MIARLRNIWPFGYGCIHLLAQWLRLLLHRKGDWMRLRDTGYIRRTETLAILGAGPSALNALENIDPGTDVLALSYAALLPVPVSVAFFEFAPPLQQKNQARVFELLRARDASDASRGSRSPTRYIYKSHLTSDTIGVLDEISTVPALIIPALPVPTVRRINRLLTVLRVHGRYIVQLDGLGSLSSAISFARWFGYKSVSLGGIDVDTRKYFFDSDEFAHYRLANPFALEGIEDLDVPHPTSPGSIAAFVERLLVLSGGMRIKCLVADSPLAAEFGRQQEQGFSQ